MTYSRGQLGSRNTYMAAVTITPSDSTDLSSSGIRAIYVGGAGNVALIGAGDLSNSGAGTAKTFTAPPVGTIIPIAPKKVLSTGTTATLLLGLT